ncbi:MULTISPECIES: phage major tail tube protein [Aminobacterium]|jgi:P2 family phage contractile tail tube protein|uniref:Major tail tube protein n=1 Tax=Aminobacterium colombiense (strain DSM 12261 / ALA-1) TaxID=572547 RepID=D5EFA5_AMICL|nr:MULTISPECIES: phage major tail tube protein [Aminobacterium]ADE57237.1 major tail tube protein [Aminobacterium colombiense DSM 12261]
MSNPVPEKLINFRVYLEGSIDLLGVADVELPSLEAMTETVKGAGIAGEVDSPVLGHFGSMGVTLNWRTLTEKATTLAKQRAHALDLRGSVQVYNAASGEYKTTPIKLAIRGIPKTIGLGKFDVGTTSDSSVEFEVVYLKLWYDGVPRIEIDKFNYICVIDEEDYLASVREDLGL